MKIPFFKQSSRTQGTGVILIVSDNPERLEYIYEYLSLKGLNHCKKLQKNILDILPADLKWDLEGVILDAKISGDINPCCLLITKIFPKNIPVIVLSDNDSIKVHQAFLDRGIFYLHSETQMDQIYEKISNFEESQSNKKSIKISILGTKGGVGNSYLSFHLARIIQERFLSRVLVVQGAESSFNLDLISGKVFEKEYYPSDGVCLYKESREDAYDFHQAKHSGFNFIIYDHSIQSLPKEGVESILNESDTVVLTMSYELDSLRKAKEILRINEFLQSVNQGSSKIHICLNIKENYVKSALALPDLDPIIEAPISVTVPYFSMDKTSLSALPKGKTQKALEFLVDELVGVLPRRKSKWI